MARTNHSGEEFHTPVMVSAVVELLVPAPGGVIIDATFGGGGHTGALLAASPAHRVLALDRDPDAIAGAPGPPEVMAVTANFADLGTVLADPAVRGWIDDGAQHHPGGGDVVGVLFDLGVSSHQLDRPERGFSYHRPGPLDMRMGPDATRSAEDIVHRWDADRLTDVFRGYGEERYARRIAERIVAERPFTDTAALAATVASAVPAPARRHGHPARRVFQALRIAVNDELSAVAEGLDAAIAGVVRGGRIVTIAYHSLEDRIVKRRFAAGTGRCTCPPELPVCVCDAEGELRRLTRKVRRPDATEIAANPRARSARLRAVEKVAA